MSLAPYTRLDRIQYAHRNSLWLTLAHVSLSQTVSAITSCILGFLEHPDVLKKAQADLDRVVKPGQLPEFDDEPSLPYITAIVKETLRWREVAPIGKCSRSFAIKAERSKYISSGASFPQDRGRVQVL